MSFTTTQTLLAYAFFGNKKGPFDTPSEDYTIRLQISVLCSKWTPMDSLLKARCLLGWYIVGLLGYTNNTRMFQVIHATLFRPTTYNQQYNNLTTVLEQ